MSERAFFSLGSNVGDREANLTQAFSRLERLMGRLCISGIYQSAPLYVTDQPVFLNAAAAGDWDGTPFELLEAVHGIEGALGRDRGKERRMGPRTLDIDILLFGQLVLDHPDLSIPHPRLAERAFALIPLLELAPGLRDPRTGRMLREYLEALGDQGVYSYAAR